jgi:hypothetical protein
LVLGRGPGLRASRWPRAASRRASYSRASMAAALTVIDEKQDKALIERTLKKHHLVRAKAAVSMVAWVAMMGGKAAEGRIG